MACGGEDDDTPPPPRDEVASAIARVTQSGTPTPADVSFDAEIEPIFVQKCTLCHHPMNATGVDLTRPFDPQTGIVGRANSWTEAPATLIVDPSDPMNSFLLDKVVRTNLDPKREGEAMPWHIPRLDAAEVGAVRQWIADGAMDDATFRTTVAPLFGDGVSLGSRGGRCAYCHNPDSSFRPDLTRPFDPVDGVVNVPGAGGRLLVAPGDPDNSALVLRIEANPLAGAAMPFHPEPLDQEERDALVRWVVAGAPDN